MLFEEHGWGSSQSLSEKLFKKGWSSLRYVDLSNNSISGSLSDDLFKDATALEYFSTALTNLEGELPKFLCNSMSSLKYIGYTCEQSLPDCTKDMCVLDNIECVGAPFAGATA